ncbi:MFS transporter [Sphingomonas sp. 2SG]|uniref:MFS transporter n=1 Tax=Sphingomonas sp. 2SG TaxID=2502201 RepID=UPI0010F85FFA|nr:MFS transporter [Sphingomonas sp. 2SG]
MLAGLMLSPVAGVPTLALIAEAAGWQAAFWTIVAITLVCIALIATGLPASPPDALRSLIGRVSLLPGTRRGEMNATLHGEFGAIPAASRRDSRLKTTKRPERRSRAFREENLIEADIRPCLECR